MVALGYEKLLHFIRSLCNIPDRVIQFFFADECIGQVLAHLDVRHPLEVANGQVSEISRATEEQARNSKHVAGAATRVSENVEQISRAMGEQSKASETLLRSANTYLEMCRQMAQAMEEQRATGCHITANSQAITEMIGSIQSKTGLHADASRQVGERFETLLELAHKTTSGMPGVARAITDLCEQVKTTHAEVQGGEHPADA